MTTERTVLGTVAYMTPEQALGRETGPPADLYALGCVLYECVTGAPPFPGDEAVAVITRHLSATPVAPTVVPPPNSRTLASASAVPLRVGVLSLVTSSLSDAPAPLAATRSGVLDAAGAVVSTVTASAPEAADTFPAASITGAFRHRPARQVQRVIGRRQIRHPTPGAALCQRLIATASFVDAVSAVRSTVLLPVSTT